VPPSPKEKNIIIKLNKNKSTTNKLETEEYLLNLVWTLRISFWSNPFSSILWDFAQLEHQVIVCATNNHWTSCQVEVNAKDIYGYENECLLISR